MNHRSEAFGIGSPPPLSGAGESMLERPRRQPSASPVRSLCLPLSFSLAVRSAGGYASGYRSHRVRQLSTVRRSGFLWLTLPKCPLLAAARWRLQFLQVGLPRLCNLPKTGDTPTCSDTKRGGGLPPPRREMSDSQPVRHGFQCGRIQRFGRIGHREIEEANGHRVAVLSLDNGTTAPSTRNLGRRRVTIGNSP